MKKIVLLLTSLLYLFSSLAQTDEHLYFNENKQFKILQLTDLHWSYQSRRNDELLRLIQRMIKKENPDLVVFTGDLFFTDHELVGLKYITRPLVDKGIPWVITLGNHDSEKGISRDVLMDSAMAIAYNYNVLDSKEVYGVGNGVIPIMNSTNTDTSMVLYLFDSNEYTPDESIGYYDWIKESQVQWFIDKSSKIPKDIPAMSFFHIPLPEYHTLATTGSFVGNYTEDISSPAYNSGLYDAFVQSQTMMAVFVGHDHDNDYIGVMDDLCLAYGRKTGFDSYDHLPKGARVIVCYEKQFSFDTWIRQRRRARIDFFHFNKKGPDN